jgi:hypothetical protein
MSSNDTRIVQRAIVLGNGIPAGLTQTAANACVIADSTQTISGNKTYSGTSAFTGAVSFTGSTLAITRTVLMQRAKIGATAGGAVNAADDLNSAARVPAGQTAATLVFYIDGVPVGSHISAIAVIGQIESAGNTATVDAALHKQTVAAAGFTTGAVTGGGITQVSVTADTALSAVNAGKTGITETVGADESHFVLVTVTTAASTDVDIMGIAVTFTTDTAAEV